MTAASTQSGLLVRWLRAAWLGWLALVLLVLVMSQVVKPRVGAFMDYWYSVPVESSYTQQATDLHQEREQQVIQRAWVIGAAPVALLFLTQLLLAFFSRSDDEEENTAEIDSGIEYVATARNSVAIEKPLVHEINLREASGRETEQTLIHYSGKLNSDTPAITPKTVKSSLDGDGALYIGQGGRYRIDRLIASGGMGAVHKGYDKTLQRDVAIKELDVSLAQDQEQSDRFRQEALALAGLAHPHIVPVYDLVEDNNRFWIVMELLSGGDLEDRIEKNRPPAKVASNIIRAVAEGLAFAHSKGIIHRDIKPMNILFNADGIPKLVDFGIAKLVQSQQSVVHTREGLSLGSPTYMSPEQVKGKKNIDKRADIYALGVTFYKTLVGEAPFTGDSEEVMRQHMFEMPVTPSELNNSISAALNAIVLKMLEKNPDDRYQSLEDFIAALDSQKG